MRLKWMGGAVAAAGMVLTLAGGHAAAQDGAAEAEPVDRASWFTLDDYPLAAKRRGEGGTVHFVLQVSAEGAVEGCRVTTSSGSETLDDATCALASARGRFTPARDAAGEAVAAEWPGEVTWGTPATKSAAWRISWPERTDLTRCATTIDGRDRRLQAKFCERLAESVTSHGGTPGQPLTIRGQRPPLVGSE